MPDGSTELAFLSTSGEAELFQHAPVALWAKDYAGLKGIFDRWRADGVTDVRAHLRAKPARLATCARSMRVLGVNRRVLDMLGVGDLKTLVAALPLIIRDDALPSCTDELWHLWAGETVFSTKSVNYTLAGRRLDIRQNVGIMPGREQSWSRVLVAIDDITAEEDATRRLVASDHHAKSLFHESPVSLWVEDFSMIKTLLDGLKSRGIADFRTFTDVHPEFVSHCIKEIRVIDVNQHTLDLYGAPDKAALLRRLGDVFGAETWTYFRGQLVELWHGRLRHAREVVNYSLSGEKLNLIMQLSVMPGYEHDWSMVLIALTDITARKKAEAYLEYLGKHDVLTGLYNRAFYADETSRLEHKGPFPVGIIVIDLDGMKTVNDQHGHAAGDAVLRRAGEILRQTAGKSGRAARTGGDEFAILLPGADPAAIAVVLAELARLTTRDNQAHAAAPAVRFSIGSATCNAGEHIETAIQHADMLMYQAKRDYYTRRPGIDRRV